MTEYEVSDLLTSTMTAVSPLVTNLATVIFAYLVVAWFVGSRLSRGQAALISLVFIFFGGLSAFTMHTRLERALYYQQALASMNPEAAGSLNGGVIIFISAVMVALLLACLLFMWQVRHPKTE